MPARYCSERAVFESDFIEWFQTNFIESDSIIGLRVFKAASLFLE
jgi:hypothetical protein